MSAGPDELEIPKGKTWVVGWQVSYNGSLIDSTWTGRSQVRRSASSTAVLHEFVVDVTDEGAVLLSVEADEALDWSWSQGVCDVEVENAAGTVVKEVWAGPVRVRREVTR